MFWRLIVILVAGFLGVLIQQGFLPFLPFPPVNLLLVVFLYIYFLNNNLKMIIFLIIWCGFLLDLFSQSVFGVFTIVALTSLFFTQWFFKYFFTSRTLPSLLFLYSFFIVTFRFLFLLLNFVTKIKFNLGVVFSAKDFFYNLMCEIIVGLIILFLAFILTDHFTKKFKNFFLVKESL